MTYGPTSQSPPPGSLFAQSRATDPLTSHVAAELMNRRGCAADHAAIVLDVVSDHPDSTYRELSAHVVGMDCTEVMRRLCDLCRKGLVRKSGARVCAVGLKLCSTWRAA